MVKIAWEYNSKMQRSHSQLTQPQKKLFVSNKVLYFNFLHSTAEGNVSVDGKLAVYAMLI